MVRPWRHRHGEAGGAVRGEEISISHLGGSDADIVFVAEGEPLSQVGRSYVFFLREGDDARFAIVGGGQGRFASTGGRLETVATEARQTPAGAAIAGMQLGALERAVGTMSPRSREV